MRALGDDALEFESKPPHCGFYCSSLEICSNRWRRMRARRLRPSSSRRCVEFRVGDGLGFGESNGLVLRSDGCTGSLCTFFKINYFFDFGRVVTDSEEKHVLQKSEK